MDTKTKIIIFIFLIILVCSCAAGFCVGRIGKNKIAKQLDAAIKQSTGLRDTITGLRESKIKADNSS